MYSLFMPLYMTELGATVVDIGLVYSLAQTVPFALNIIGGWLSDKFGRLRVINWGNFLKVLAFIVMIIANRWEWMIAGFALIGASGAIGGPSFSAFIADEVEEEHLAKVYAVQQNIRNLANLLIGPLAGLIVANQGYKRMLLAAGSAHVLGTILLMINENRSRLETDPDQGPGIKLPFRKSLGLIIGLVFAGGLFSWLFVIDHLNDIFLGMSQSLNVLYLERVVGIGVEQIGILPTIGGIIGLIVTIPLGYWVDKRGENIGLGLAYFLLAVHAGVPLIARNFWMLIPGAVVYPFMLGLAGPAYNSLVSKAVPEEQRGIAFGLTWTSRGLIAIPTPYLGGLMWDRIAPQAPFLFAVIGCFGLSVLAFLKLKSPRDDKEESNSY
jgi:DHA1 family multidrug resistance protein B-like MFS transporter